MVTRKFPESDITSIIQITQKKSTNKNPTSAASKQKSFKVVFPALKLLIFLLYVKRYPTNPAISFLLNS